MSAELRRAVGSTLRSVPCGVSIEMTLTPVTRVSPTQVAVGMEALYQRWPQCRTAVQPPPLPKAIGTTDVLGRWARDANNFRLRDPAASAENLIGPFAGNGTCLAPYFMPGDLMWIDPDCEPADGDFIILLWNQSFFERLMRAADRFVEDLGRAPSGIACKRLAIHNGAWHVTSVGEHHGSTATVPLQESVERVLGVVRYVERAASSLPALEAHCIRLEKVNDTTLIGPNATSDNVIVENATDTNLATAFGGSYGGVGSASFEVPANETWRLSIEYQCWALIGAGPGLAGNFRVLVDGSQIQEVRTFDDNMASQEHQFSWSYVADFGAGTHSFTIEGRATSSTAVKKHAVVKVTVLKR